MKISHIDIYQLPIKMEPFRIATGVMDYAQNIYVRIHADTGVYGVGECSAFPMIVGENMATCYLLAQQFAALWKNKNPLEIEARLLELEDWIHGNHTVKSAFDMALYDIASKNENQPLYAFLGGTKKDIQTDITVGIDTPEKMAAKAQQFIDNGFHILKVKVGHQPEEDILRIKKIRDAVGDKYKIRIDANQGWSFEDAVTALRGMEKYAIEFCEQPMRTWDNYLLPQLKNKTSIPLMADESVYTSHDIAGLAEYKAIDAVNIKFAKCGGIHEAIAIADTAAKYHLPCMMGGMLETRLAATAKGHFAVSQNNVKYFDMDTALLGHLEDPVTGGMIYDKDIITLPDMPGIGADINAEYLQQQIHMTI